MRWKVTDPLGNEIFLKNSTYTEHILASHGAKDAMYRAQIESEAQRTLKAPTLIVFDGMRNLYYRAIGLVDEMGELLKIRTLKVLVETDRTPQEVVTWTILRKGDNVKGAIIYDSISGKQI